LKSGQEAGIAKEDGLEIDVVGHDREVGSIVEGIAIGGLEVMRDVREDPAETEMRDLLVNAVAAVLPSPKHQLYQQPP
jgi:hypothetical protein